MVLFCARGAQIIEQRKTFHIVWSRGLKLAVRMCSLLEHDYFLMGFECFWMGHKISPIGQSPLGCLQGRLTPLWVASRAFPQCIPCLEFECDTPPPCWVFSGMKKQSPNGIFSYFIKVTWLIHCRAGSTSIPQSSCPPLTPLSYTHSRHLRKIKIKNRS